VGDMTPIRPSSLSGDEQNVVVPGDGAKCAFFEFSPSVDPSLPLIRGRSFGYII